MSTTEPKGPYIYQPYGIQDGKVRWDSGRIYAVSGISDLARIDGLTRDEADRVLEAITRKL